MGARHWWSCPEAACFLGKSPRGAESTGAERVTSTTTLGGGREGLRVLLRTQTSERRQNEWYWQPPGAGGAVESLTPTAQLVLALALCKELTSPTTCAEMLCSWEGSQRAWDSHLAYKQEEEQDASGRARSTNGNLLKPLLNKGRQPLLGSGEGAPGVGPMRKPGNQAMCSLPQSRQ